MKKCASCTKDLPDAALHCVFCGAKQPPAPAVQQSMAKTAFGYTGNEPQRGQPAPGFPAQPPRPQPPMATAPTMMPPPPSHGPLATAQTAVPPPPPARSPMAMAATQAVPAYPGSSLPPAPGASPPAFQPPPGPATIPAPSAYGPPGQAFPAPSPFQPPAQKTIPAPSPSLSQPAGLAPASNAGAATLFVQGPGPAPQGSFGRAAPMQPTMVPQPLQPVPLPVAQPAPQMPQPMAIPAAMGHAYQTSPTATNVRRPIDPWRDSLRAMMFIWGFLLIAAFATPVALKPELAFLWTGLLDNLGTAQLPKLTIAAVGVLALVLAFVPMPTSARGVLATVLGLAGLAVPIALVGVPPWQVIVPLVGAMLLLPGLIIRSEYLAAILPRLLVTLGVAGVLINYLLPQHDTIPLVALFKALIEAPGSAKVGPALELGLIVIVVMALLAWLPSPATGGAKLWAWLFILWPLVTHVVELVMKGGIADRITGSPNEALAAWIAMGPAYLVLIAYGLAAVLGKQLE